MLGNIGTCVRGVEGYFYIFSFDVNTDTKILIIIVGNMNCSSVTYNKNMNKYSKKLNVFSDLIKIARIC